MGDAYQQGQPGEDDEDYQLAYAIALSLKDPERESQEPIVISSSDDENINDLDQEPLDKSNPLPKSKMAPADTQDIKPNEPVSNSNPGLASSRMGFLGLDRKKMEEERIARLGKRNAPDSEVESQGRQQRLKPLHPGRPKSVMETILSSNTKIQSHNTVARSGSKTGKLVYPKGVVRKAYVRGRPRTDDDITIEEVLQKDELKLAVLGSFQWDEEWLLSKIHADRTKMILVAFAPNDATKAQMVENVPSKRIRFCFPPMNGPGSMHSKLQLLKFSHYMRIVVPTGNLMPYDWGETGRQENAVFLIDIPKRSIPPNDDEPSDLTQFAQDMFYFLRAMGLDETLVSSLEKGYDFSETSRYGFVHAIAGSHKEGAWQRTGYCGLGRTIKSLGLATSHPVEIDFMAASLGSLKQDFLISLYNAAQGDSGLKELEARASHKSRKMTAATKPEDDQMTLLTERFRIYFPSHQTIVRSAGGTQGAGTICFRREWWNLPAFPRALLLDCKNAARPGILMHNKMMFVRPHQHQEGQQRQQGQQNTERKEGRKEAQTLAKWLGGETDLGRKIGSSSEDAKQKGERPRDRPRGVCGNAAAASCGDGRTKGSDDDGDDGISGGGVGEHSLASAVDTHREARQACWTYVGSANLSESAWGRMTMDAKTKQPKLTCRNWECGVVVTVPVVCPGSGSFGNGSTSSTNSTSSNGGHASSIDADEEGGEGKVANMPGQQQQEQQLRPLVPDMDVFKNIVNVPFQLPAARLDGVGEGRPWFFMEGQ